MKLVRFSSIGKGPALGVVEGDAVAEVPSHLGLKDDMAALIAGWSEHRAVCEEVRGRKDYALDEVTLHAPVGRPGKIFGIGLNYADHAEESGLEKPDCQIWFTKAQTSINGPYDPIELPKVSSALDYEAELVFVIGKRCRHVSADDAKDVIFGFSVGNDVSVRDWQLRTSQFVLGKSFDTHAPIGPWIVTTDDFDATELGIRAYVNGEKRQDSNTRYLIFDCADQVAELSQAMTLEPGDIVFTGTPGGVGGAMTPPRFLRAGDVVRVEIDGIGHIENMVEPEN